ncbi:MAG: substrate-binding domain-containing protein [Candidatus Helarchaeota archaeon]|nr:substrate-binding domain-containing protein [Candidatus Helarchaeota archaeon]
MTTSFERKRRKGSGILILLLVIGAAVGFPIGFYVGSDKPTDDYLTMVYSSEKKGWIEDLIVPFKEWYYQNTNRTISVNFRSMGSREMVIALQTGEIKPILWSPASNLQVSMLEALIPGMINPADVYSYIYSPTVIGTWNNTLYANMDGFVDFQAIAAAPGDVRFAHTDPRLSNSGYTSMMMQLAAYFNSTIGDYYNASKITVANITDASGIDDALKVWLEGIEKDADYYGKSTGYLGEKAKTDYDVYYVYENVIIEINKDPNLNKKALALYPVEGVFSNYHPFCILNADWVSPHDIDVARNFTEFLGLDPSIAKAFERGFRPINTSILSNPTYNQTFNEIFNEEYGVEYDPPLLVHGPPQDSLVLDYVTDVWLMVRAD